MDICALEKLKIYYLKVKYKKSVIVEGTEGPNVRVHTFEGTNYDSYMYLVDFIIKK